MKIRYNRFAVFPVMCHDCHRYIWMEPYTEERGRQVIQENKRKCMAGWLKEFDYTKLSYEEAEQVYTLVAGLKNS